ncbi:MAG: hypothetical protein HY062_02875 [Bacteroidetes bacterium]|nr:hypothetical protein [Bacteroidota bacterium]
MEKQVIITSGNVEVLDSGTFLTFDEKEVVISVIYKDEEIKLHLRFEDSNDKKGEMKINFEVINAQEMRIIFIDYNNTLGQFNRQPVELGTIANRAFYFAYYIVHLHDTKRKQINYSFYLGEEVKNG